MVQVHLSSSELIRKVIQVRGKRVFLVSERWFDVITSDGENHLVSFTAPSQMEEWMVERGMSTKFVSVLWDFPDYRQWVHFEGSFVRNAKAK